MTYGLDVQASSPVQPPIRFRARVIRGAGRGKQLGIPTLNLELREVPAELTEGIYACFVIIDGSRLQGAMHYGPRPVFKSGIACEIHLLDTAIDEPPRDVDVDVRGRIREVRDFPSTAAMLLQIKDDIAAIRSILGACSDSSSN